LIFDRNDKSGRNRTRLSGSGSGMTPVTESDETRPRPGSTLRRNRKGYTLHLGLVSTGRLFTTTWRKSRLAQVVGTLRSLARFAARTLLGISCWGRRLEPNHGLPRSEFPQNLARSSFSLRKLKKMSSTPSSQTSKNIWDDEIPERPYSVCDTEGTEWKAAAAFQAEEDADMNMNTL